MRTRNITPPPTPEAVLALYNTGWTPEQIWQLHMRSSMRLRDIRALLGLETHKVAGRDGVATEDGEWQILDAEDGGREAKVGGE